MHFKVITDAENTGLDGAVFATEDEATEAANMAAKMFTDSKFEVAKTTEPVNTTFAAWNESGW